MSEFTKKIRDVVETKAGKIATGVGAAGIALHIGSKLSERQDISPAQMNVAMEEAGKTAQKMDGEAPSSEEFKKNVKMEEKDKIAYEEVEIEPIDMNDPRFLTPAYNETMEQNRWALNMNVTKNYEYLKETLQSLQADNMPIFIYVEGVRLKAVVQTSGTPTVLILLIHSDKDYLQNIAKTIVANKNKLRVSKY